MHMKNHSTKKPFWLSSRKLIQSVSFEGRTLLEESLCYVNGEFEPLPKSLSDKVIERAIVLEEHCVKFPYFTMEDGRVIRVNWGRKNTVQKFIPNEVLDYYLEYLQTLFSSLGEDGGHLELIIVQDRAIVTATPYPDRIEWQVLRGMRKA